MTKSQGQWCMVCNRHFSSPKALGGHMRIHYRALPICPRPPVAPPRQLNPQMLRLNTLFPPPFLLGESRATSSMDRSLTRKRSTRRRRMSFQAAAARNSPPPTPVEDILARFSGEETLTDSDAALCIMLLSRDKCEGSDFPWCNPDERDQVAPVHADGDEQGNAEGPDEDV